MRDELVSLFKSLDREGHDDVRGFYLTAWNGDSPYKLDRIARGMNLTVPGVCLSLLGGTQPARIAGYIRAAVRGDESDDGLIQRFGMLVWPDSCPPWEDNDLPPNVGARDDVFRLFEELAELDSKGRGAQQDGHDTLPYFRLDEAALALFREWRNKLETELRSGTLHPALESHFTKYRKLIPGLALIAHLADGYHGDIGAICMVRALCWYEYLRSHAERAYASVTMGDVVAAHALLAKIREQVATAPFCARDIYRNQWAHLSDKELVFGALDILVDHHVLAMFMVPTEERQKGLYYINPAAYA